MPELIAILHSFVGLAAVLVGYNSFLTEPSDPAHLVEVFLGVLIGAVTFTGSIVAYLKLSTKISSAPLMLPGRNWLNLGMVVASGALLAWFLGTGSVLAAAAHDRRRARARLAPGGVHRRRRHAGRRLDAQLVLRVGGRRGGLHAQQRPAHRHRRARRLVRCDPQLPHVHGHEPVVRQRHPRRVRHRRRDGRRRRTPSSASTTRSSRPRPPSCSPTPAAWSSRPGTAWPSPRRSTPSRSSSPSCAPAASTCGSGSTRSRAGCPGT